MNGLAEYVKRTVDAAPPLTTEQLDRISALLRGRQTVAPTPPPPKPQATTVYRHYDACGCLLYIGIAYDAVKRTYQHAGTSWWSKWTERIEMQSLTYAHRSEAVDAEREFIRAENPAFNKVHAVDRDGAVKRYLINHERWEHLSVPAAVDASELPDLIRTLDLANMLGGVIWTKEPR